MITNTYIAIILYTEFLSDQSTNFPKFIYYLHSFSDITQTFKLHNYLITVNNYERFLFKTPKPNAPATPASPKPTTAASLLSFSPICGSVAALASAFGASAFLAIALTSTFFSGVVATFLTSFTTTLSSSAVLDGSSLPLASSPGSFVLGFSLLSTSSPGLFLVFLFVYLHQM